VKRRAVLTAGYLRDRAEPGLAANVMNPAHPDDANPDWPPPARPRGVRSGGDELPPAGHRTDRSHVPCAARLRPSRRRAHRGVRPRGRRRGQDRRRPAVAAVPAGRARTGLTPADRPGQLAQPGPERLPRATAGSARHRPVHPGQPADPGQVRLAGGSGRVPGAVPRRQHRPGRRTDPGRGHRRCAVERAGAELRRILRGHLPVAGPGGDSRGVHYRWAARARRDRRRRVPGRLSPGHREEHRALRALPGRCGTRAAETSGCPAAVC
jgi:hypothetical protein